MSADEPGRLPASVDLTELAGLVAPLIGQVDSEALAQRCAAEVVAELKPIMERIEAAAQVERRRVGPFVPPPTGSTN